MLTNDGAMAQALLHDPQRAKDYHAPVKGSLDAERLERWCGRDSTTAKRPRGRRHVSRHDDSTPSSRSARGRIARSRIGRGRAVVLRLTRVSFAGLRLEGLRPGQMRPLSNGELNELKQKYLNPSKKVGKPRGSYASHDELEEEPPRSAWAEGEISGRAASAGRPPRAVRTSPVAAQGAHPRGERIVQAEHDEPRANPRAARNVRGARDAGARGGRGGRDNREPPRITPRGVRKTYGARDLEQPSAAPRRGRNARGSDAPRLDPRGARQASAGGIQAQGAGPGWSRGRVAHDAPRVDRVARARIRARDVTKRASPRAGARLCWP